MGPVPDFEGVSGAGRVGDAGRLARKTFLELRVAEPFCVFACLVQRETQTAKCHASVLGSRVDVACVLLVWRFGRAVIHQWNDNWFWFYNFEIQFFSVTIY